MQRGTVIALREIGMVTAATASRDDLASVNRQLYQ
jgi:hypothetical protein